MYAVPSEDTEAPPQPRTSERPSDGEEEEAEEEDEEEEEEADDGGTPQLHPPSGVSLSSSNLIISAVSNLSSLSHLREIGKEALCWQLSSAKPGNGVEQIRDGNVDSYWQSDGTKQPHWIQVHFARRVAISHVCLYLDYALDESYTPKKICVDHGMTSQDLQPAVYPEKTEIEFQEPVGWCIVPLSSPPDPLDECCQAADDGEVLVETATATATTTLSSPKQLVRTHMLRISILSMHQNGRDTHIRQVELYGPRMMSGADANNIVATKTSSLAALSTTTTTAGAAARRSLLDNNNNNNIKQQQPQQHNVSEIMHDGEEEDDDCFGEIAFPPFGSIR